MCASLGSRQPATIDHDRWIRHTTSAFEDRHCGCYCLDGQGSQKCQPKTPSSLSGHTHDGCNEHPLLGPLIIIWKKFCNTAMRSSARFVGATLQIVVGCREEAGRPSGLEISILEYVEDPEVISSCKQRDDWRNDLKLHEINLRPHNGHVLERRFS